MLNLPRNEGIVDQIILSTVIEKKVAGITTEYAVQHLGLETSQL